MTITAKFILPSVSAFSMKTNQTICGAFLSAAITHIDLGNRNSLTDAFFAETDSGGTDSN